MRDAPVLILFHADDRIPMADANAQLAIQNAALMVHALGLGAVYTGLLTDVSHRDKSIGRMLGLPEHHRICGGLALGYPRYQFKKWVERRPAKVTWL